MQRVIGVTELQRRFRSVFDEVANENIAYVLTRGSRPEVVMIPYKDFLRYQAMQEEAILARFDVLVERMASRNVASADGEIASDVEAARSDQYLDRRSGL